MKKNYFWVFCLILLSFSSNFAVTNNFDGLNSQFNLLNSLNIVKVLDVPTNYLALGTVAKNLNSTNRTNLFAPSITLPADITIECDESSLPGNTGTATATDNDSCINPIVVTYNDSSTQTSDGSCSDYTYVITRTWTATETCGNTFASADQTINVQDTTPPVLTVPADVTVQCDNIPAVGTPTATDNCDAAVAINYDGEVRTNGACTDTYTLTRTWTATDNCGLTHTVSQTINVQDTTPPVLTVPADVTVQCDNIPAVGTPTATDNCDAAVAINYDGEVRTNGACTDTYTLTRTWTATDNCGLTHTVSQTINVQDTTPPVLTVPADVTVQCDNIPAVGTPTATDNCDAAVAINYDGEVRTNGACTDTYTLTRTWTATDNCGLTHTVSQTINVQDTTPPVLTVPADVTVQCDNIPAVGTPTATDNCDAAVAINYDGEVRTNGACTDTYTLTRTWTATDNCGLTHTVSQTINVQDTTPPVLTVPADVTVQCDNIPAVGTPTATDNCDAAVAINYDGEVRTNGACTDTYTLTRTWTATDNCGLTHTVSQTINVQDTTPPVLTVPADVTVQCDNIPAVGTPTATDNCDAAVAINYDGEVRTNGACTDTYTLTRTWTATDNCGLTHTVSQTINVQDTTPPVLTVPADVTVQCDNIPAVGTPTATDNCDAAVAINYDGEVRTNGACTDTYTLTRTWTATDNCGLTHTVSQTINVQDTTPPVLTVPADVTVQCDNIPAVGTPTATDNCDAAVAINYDGEVRTNGACTDTYTLTRTWTATDNCGLTHTVSQTINVQDTTPPVLTVPADVTVQCDNIPAVGTPTATDNCDAAVAINYDGEVRTNGACTDTYTLTRTWTATDNCGLTHTVSQTINVQDTTPPVLTVPADVTVQCDNIPAVGTPTATDNCDAAVAINYDGEVRTNGACTDTYTLTRTWTATDNCGLTHTVSQTINVQDTTPPVLTVPADVTVQCDNIPAVGTPTATDNCDAAVAINYDGEVRTNGACTDTYTLTRTWTATDNCGLTHTVSQTINVQDTTPPVLTVPADVTVQCDNIPAVGTPTATDNCDAAVAINYDGEVRTNGACTDTYTLTRTWTATDNCGLTHTVSQTINVQDTTPPVLTVPADVTVQCDNIPAVGTPTATDNCDAAVAINYDGEVRTNGACTDTYTLTRTWTATDNCGLTHTVSQTINVQDTTPPVLTVPADVTVQCDNIPAVGTPTATDNCDAAVAINYDGEVRTNGACTDTYTLTRTWTATDNCGLTHTVSQTINVQDTTPPVLTVPADVTVQCDNIPAVGTPTATDNCDAAVAINYDGEVRTNGACTDTYTLTRTWTATDNCGLTHTVSQTINVQDTTPPVLTVPADVTVQCDNIPAVGTPTATDNCDAAVAINYDGEVRTNGACTDTYTLTRTWTATDNCGLTHTVSQTINVQDTTPPVLTVPADVTVQCDNIPAVGTPTATDNCDAAVAINYDGEVRTNGACTDTYTLTRTWTATDNCGLTHTVSQTINVQDTTPPVLTVPADVTVQCDNIPAVGTPTATDNCDAAVAINYDGEVRTNGACTDTYTLTRTWTATDNCGLTHTVSQTINVQDTTPPVLTVPADVTVQCDNIPAVGTPTATDNCDAAVAINYDGEVRTNGACTDTYTLTRTWTATDNCGLTHTVSQTINVQDTTPPVLTVPADVTVQCDNIPAVGTPTATDNCDAAVAINYDGEVRTNGACTDTYTLTRTWTATDNCGLTHTVSQTINVQDTTPPVLTVPADVTVQCDNIPAVGTPTATDNCDAAVAINYDGEVRTNGACTDTYTLTRTWTATDNCGLTHTVSQTINVQDTAPPVITTCLGNQNVSFDNDCEYTLLDYTSSIIATDSCGSVAITQNPAPGTTITSTTQITITATDDCGNTSTCNFNVIPSDTTNPTAICQDLTLSLEPDGTVSINATQIDGGSSDNCGISSITVSPSTFDCNDIGTNMVTLTVTDVNGLVSTCMSTVTIEDHTPPNASCGATTITIDSFTGLATISDVNSLYTGSGDECGNVTLNLAQTEFNCNNIGTNNVTLTITDTSGNSSYCTVVVTVEAPTITSGTLTGVVVNPTPNNPVPASELIEVTACPGGVAEPKDVQLTLNLDGNSTINAGNIDRWQISNDEGLSWTDVTGTEGLLQHTLTGLLSTTLVRIVIESGTCKSISPLAVIRFLPPDEPPIIVSTTDLTICLTESVTINAESYFEYASQFGEGGFFNYAQPEDWRVDKIDGFFPASGNNADEPTWKESNGPKILSGIRYDVDDNTKFAAANGPYYTTLETPVFNTIGMSASDAVLEFYQAYYFCSGGQGKILLSLDGGDTYDIELTTDQGDTYNSGTQTDITVNSISSCNSNNNGQHPSNNSMRFTSIDLSAYINMAGLRVMFEFDALNTSQCTNSYFASGASNTCNTIPNNFNVYSSWVIDNVGFPYAPIDEVLEWTDENGVVVQTGETFTYTPPTPGIQDYGVTSLVNGCRADGDDGTQFVTIETSLAYAGQNFTPLANNCGQSSIGLNAYDNALTAVQNYDNGAWESSGQGYYVVPNTGAGEKDYPGTGVGGTWSIITSPPNACGITPTFSSATNPRATFTGEPGTYTLRWTLANGCYDQVDVTITSCDQIDFDGNDDYVTFRNNYPLGNAFSIQAWVKPNSITGNRTILSKKLASVNNAGYNLNVVNGQVRFNWYSGAGNGYIYASNNIGFDRWYHITVTFDGSAYKLYVDGIDVGTTTGTITAPAASAANVECLLGALDDVAGPSNSSIENFHGWIDELRIWNSAISVEQIRETMNQRIQANGAAVRGEVLQFDVSGLNWANLDGYYRMDLGCGNLTPYKGVAGRLININSSEDLTAPLPYTSRANTPWTTDTTWTNYDVWDVPNSNGINNTPIDWNIVRTAHNITSGDKDITVLGLLVDANELSIEDPSTPLNQTNDGQMLWVTHYLKLDGRLDLVGESQLIQKRYNSNQFGGSIFDNTSAGYAERDQQGQVNPYNYNYFSPPFAPNNATVNNENTSNTFTIGGVLRDGTTTVANPINRNIVWTGNNTATGGDPTQVSTRWLYAYNDNAGNTYSEWEYLNSSGSLNIGLGFTMKGSGNATAKQNYVFVGKPNNGTIVNNVSPAVGGLPNDILLGNPYPSALDAEEFIKDNIPLLYPDGSPSQAYSNSTESVDGTLYFWEHYNSNATHVLRDYEGGYATFNLLGALPATTPPATEDGVIIIGGNGTVIPERYIPVAQGFFVTGSPGGGLIKFENDQRVFQRENPSSSVFFGANNGVQETKTTTKSANPNSEVLIQRIRLTFKSPEGAIRPLLLGFVPNNWANDGYNYGYDAKYYDNFPSDMYWLMQGEKYVMQGVGYFDASKKYPVGIQLGISGEIRISLKELENFDAAIPVYVYDSLLNTYTQINDSDFVLTLDANSYSDRFFISFEPEDTLSTNSNNIDSIRLYYLQDTQEIYINWVNSYDIKEVKLINILGQEVKHWNNIEPLNQNEIKIPLKNISDGNYIIKVINKQGKTTNKKVVIKQ